MMRGILGNCFEMILGRTSVVCMMRSTTGEKDIFLYVRCIFKSAPGTDRGHLIGDLAVA
jgi:hypothetical protein